MVGRHRDAADGAAAIAMTDEKGMSPSERYARTFASDPPLVVWDGSGAQLDALMLDAIRRGRALTENDLLKAQGRKPIRPGVFY